MPNKKPLFAKSVLTHYNNTGKDLLTPKRIKKIPTIGFQIPDFTYPYLRQLWNGINEVIRDCKANLITF